MDDKKFCLITSVILFAAALLLLLNLLKGYPPLQTFLLMCYSLMVLVLGTVQYSRYLRGDLDGA